MNSHLRLRFFEKIRALKLCRNIWIAVIICFTFCIEAKPKQVYSKSLSACRKLPGFVESFFNYRGKSRLFYLRFYSQPAWMHLRCISETSHAASQRHLKERWCANLWDIFRENVWRCLLKDVSEISQAFSETSLSCIWGCNSWSSN